jgi:hypothetical protein
MKTPIGFLSVGSFIKKGGNIMQVIAIDKSDTAAVDNNGMILNFDTLVLDLQDVKVA